MLHAHKGQRDIQRDPNYMVGSARAGMAVAPMNCVVFAIKQFCANLVAVAEHVVRYDTTPGKDTGVHSRWGTATPFYLPGGAIEKGQLDPNTNTMGHGRLANRGGPG